MTRFLFALIVALPVWLQTPIPLASGEPVTLIVRDTGGAGLPNVRIDIALVGPPDEPYSQCVTDDAGECALSLPASDYALTFIDQLGAPFVPPAEQNVGPVEEAGEGPSGGGFGIHLDPTGQSHTFLFVIATNPGNGFRDSALVPLWDNAHTRDQAPDPYVPPQLKDEINLNPLIAATPMGPGQVIVSGYDSSPTPLATLMPTPPPGSANTPSPNTLAMGLYGLLLCAVLAGVASLAVWLIRRRRK